MTAKFLRKWNNIIHRDLGYFFFGLTIMYSISGIVLNHVKSGGLKHPDYGFSYKETQMKVPADMKLINESFILTEMTRIGEQNNFKRFITSDKSLEVFLKDGSIRYDLETGTGIIEKRFKRYLIKEFNFLHYNSIKKWWTWYSDFFAVGLIVLALTGLFVIRGKKGITGRGWVVTLLGLIVPVLFLIVYL